MNRLAHLISADMLIQKTLQNRLILYKAHCKVILLFVYKISVHSKHVKLHRKFVDLYEFRAQFRSVIKKNPITERI